jgi:hypothetical protein
MGADGVRALAAGGPTSESVDGLGIPGTGCAWEAPCPVAPKTCVLLVPDAGGDWAGAGGPPNTCVRPAAGGDGVGWAGFGWAPKTCVRPAAGGGSGWAGFGGPPKTCVRSAGGGGATGAGMGRAPKTSVRLEAVDGGSGWAGFGGPPKTCVRLATGGGAAGGTPEDSLPTPGVPPPSARGGWAVPKDGVGVGAAPRGWGGGVPPKIWVPAFAGGGAAPEAPAAVGSWPGR